MAYFAPFIDSAGLHLPVFDDISQYEVDAFLSVYGQTVSTGADQSDIQWIDVFSLMINDAFNTAQLVYNSRSPLTAIGSDLDAICKCNGIFRKQATASTAALTVSGIANTLIPAGVVQDVNANLWNLPVNVTIPVGGSVIVTATCATIGAIAALPNTINIISQPTKGWNTVTNALAAVIGQPVENDSQLRARQAISVGISSKTQVFGTIAGIAAVPNVTRYALGTQTPGTTQGTSVENPTGAVDSWGNPAHSISMVVEGGTDLAVATAIYNNKTPGCFTNGTTSVAVIDPNTLATTNIGFFRPVDIPIFTTLTINPLPGYTSATKAAIESVLLTYLNSLQIGELVSISALSAIASSVMPNLSAPIFSITACVAGTSSGGQTTTDITIAFNAVAQGVAANITVND